MAPRVAKTTVKTVDAIIKRKWDAGLDEEDPDVPGHYLYYTRDKTTFTATQANAREFTLTARTKLDKTAAEKLTAKGGLFGEGPLGAAKKGFKALETRVPAATALAAVAAKASKVTAGVGGGGGSTGEEGKGKGGGSNRKPKEEVANVLKAKTPADQARDLAHKCLEDSAKARTLLEKLHGVIKAESMIDSLKAHSEFFTGCYHKWMAKIKAGETEEADYAKLSAEIVVQRKPFVDDYDFAQAVATGIHKPKKDPKTKAKAKTKSST